MSGYESVRDWAFDNYDFNKYDTFQKWLDVIESDFDLNGRGIPLRKIFDIQDFIDLENEFNLRKGEDEEERLREEEEEEERRIEEEERKEEVEEKIRKDELNIFESIVESVVETVGSAVGSVVESVKRIFGRFRK